MKRLRISGLARAEVREAYQWYEREEPGLGRRFLTAVDKTLASVTELPQAYPVLYKNTRRAIVKRFPYGVFFQDRRDHVKVVAVVHLRRHPDTWKRRP